MRIELWIIRLQVNIDDMDFLFLKIFAASIIGSVFAMLGGVLLLINEGLARKLSLYLLSFAAGSLLGAALFELIPESLEVAQNSEQVFLAVAIGVMIFFVLEKILNFYHCHDQEICAIHDFSPMVIVGDAFHNFLDGIAIALSFLISIPTGIATTAAVFFHEVPQEISDFGILIHNNYSKWKTFKYNFWAALGTPIGAILGYLSRDLLEPWIPILLGIAAGSFIYISISDLIPELRHKTGVKEFSHILIMVAGMAIIWAIGILLPE